MEIESDNGDNISLKTDAPSFIGRSHVNIGPSVSRRHLSLELHSSNQKSDEPRVSLEAVGKNPVWVRDGRSGEIRVYRKGERAELGSGDAFSIYGKKHVWFRLSRAVEETGGGRVVDEGFGDVSDLEFDDVDVSQIDAVKEFGFIVMGHEFDSYGKQMVRDIRKWKWFLEEPKKGSDDDDDDDDDGAVQRSKRQGRKRKKGKPFGQGGDDDDWEGESEEDKDLISNAKKVPKPTYSTRSKEWGKSTKLGTKGNGKSKIQESSNTRKGETEDENDNADDDDDETLGGFIVDNEEEIEDEIGGVEEEEDEFKDDDEELE